MKITEQEARTIIGLNNIAQMEMEGERGNKLVERVRKEFPEIDRDMRISEIKDETWSTIVEEHASVKEVRKKLSNLLKKRDGIPIPSEENEAWHGEYGMLVRELDEVKKSVVQELESKDEELQKLLKEKEEDEHGYPIDPSLPRRIARAKKKRGEGGEENEKDN